MRTNAKGLVAIRIGNFKAFAETQQIAIRPLTLIYGANSAGKSSVIHSLLLANQALENGNVDVRQTRIGGESVDLGGFRQYVHRHDLRRLFEWTMEVDHGHIETVVRFLGGFSKASMTFQIGFSSSSAESAIATKAPCILGFELALDGCRFLRLESRPGGRLHSVGLNFGNPVLRATIERLVHAICRKVIIDDNLDDAPIEKEQKRQKREKLRKEEESSCMENTARLMGEWEQITEVMDADISKVPLSEISAQASG